MSIIALEARVLGLASKAVIMPVEEIRLSSELAAHPDATRSLPRILSWTTHQNFHVRRVAITTLRKMRAYGATGVLEALVRALGDAEGWVRYDAAWALRDRGGAEPEVIAALERLARGVPVPTEQEEAQLDIDDEVLMARVEAARALASLRAAAPLRG
ncbi:MAG: HEAT repeat domain-containing protein [Myxococcaceae bacterium]|nr:HEAT repeat domain-containing protein [Myxococcaceae bacterium]